MSTITRALFAATALWLGCGAGDEPGVAAGDAAPTLLGDTSSANDQGSPGPSALDVDSADTRSPAPDGVAPGDSAALPDAADPVDWASPVDTSPNDALPTDTPQDDTGSPDTAQDAAASPDLPQDDASPLGPTTLTLTLEGADDAVASYLIDAASGAWNVLGGASVPVGRHWDAAHVSYYTALRFPNAAIPPGATIDSATLTVFPTNEVDSSHPLWLNVWAEGGGDSAPLSLSNTETGRPDQRAHTTAGVDHWLIRCNATCTELTEYDCPQRMKDCWDRETPYMCPKPLAPLVQEVVADSGWTSGGAITVFLFNAATAQDGAKYEDSRSITGFDAQRGPAYGPTLEITWHLDP